MSRASSSLSAICDTESEMGMMKGLYLSVLKENHQLRETLQQQRKASAAGVSALHSQLESHILRLQQHTDELRGTDQPPKACLSPSAPKDPRRLGFADTLR
ncbi:hypothetical protein AK812_SmicGene12507 [Symbiodinium microadriaticum]|uniref:Uncharacterized protein n=1 Tax=Symbiodinium microadriaticum TaxID=2951 RepID=A0A1Q9EAI7_SYMMI|nr:hypothetical protein AK812_SmicGene12507 [Symbiodinium microadriaticum]